MIPAGLDALTWGLLRDGYRERCGVALYVVDGAGRAILGAPTCGKCREAVCPQARMFAIREALRWGEPAVGFCPGNELLWAMPLMRNQELVGGVVAAVPEEQAFAAGTNRPVLNIRGACRLLREMVEAANLSNAAALELRRREYVAEQERAYAIHSFKAHDHNSVRELYLREEPALFSAIRAGDRGVARGIINRVLVVIHHYAGDRLDLIKSVFLELVVSMCRTAVEAGGDPQELLGTNYERMSSLARVASQEELAHWLRKALEHLMDAVEQRRGREPGAVLAGALTFMEQRYGEQISRDDVARAVHVSASHFSALVRREAGTTFTDLLTRIRVDRAAELLRRSDLPAGLVAERCGFRDASYFTKVFKRYRGVTPKAYRQR